MARRYRHPHHRAFVISETLEAWIFVFGIIAAVVLINTDIVLTLVEQASSALFASFVAGVFFTSTLTTVPAIVALVEISQNAPLWHIALAGGCGAVVGDLILFRFIRSRLIERLMRAAFSAHARRIGRAIASGPLWWLAPLFGALIIASPLPDELGLIMMGLSHIRTIQFIPLVFVANVIGILALAAVAQSF